MAFSRHLTLAGLLFAVLAMAGVSWQLASQLEWSGHVDIAAHRGASLVAPENSLAAVRKAIEAGATYVEIDVQLSSDGEVVVNHDADLMRMAGVPLVINATPLEQLRQHTLIDLPEGSSPHERMPTLDEVIDLTRGEVQLIIELKSYQSDAQALADAVVKKIAERDLLDHCVVMSLVYRELQMVRELNPEIITGFVASASLGDMMGLEVDFLAVATGQATEALITTAHAHRKLVYVWTVDDPDEMAIMIDRGVDNLITNDPAAAVVVLQERSELGLTERILLRFRSLYVW